MRSSDQRYRQVQRTKRSTEQWQEWSNALVLALREAKLNLATFPAVERAVRGGAPEFGHILLASGRTANDFRRNYRQGSPHWHVLPTNSLCSQAALESEKLDGFTLMRLSREQVKNVKLRWMKLRAGDILIHDPQGALWTKLMAAMLAGSRDEHLGLLCDLRDRGDNLVEQNALMGSEGAVDRAARQLVKLVQGFGTDTPEWVEDWDEARCAKEARGAWRRLKEMISLGAAWHNLSEPEFRVELEKELVVVEAFIDGGNVMAAAHNPDTSGRHSRLQPRLDRVRAVRVFPH